MAEHYFTKIPRSTLKKSIIRCTVAGISVLLHSGSGVFSKDKLDTGTAVLLEHMVLPKTGQVLDLGCGIGIVGIVVKRKAQDLEVFMSDINERAVQLAKKNAKENRVDAEVRSGDGFAPWEGEKFDCILLNPPQHAGKDTCFQLIEGASKHLTHKGTFQLVARRKKGGASLAKHMEDIFGNVEEIGKKSGFGVWVSRKD